MIPCCTFSMFACSSGVGLAKLSSNKEDLEDEKQVL